MRTMRKDASPLLQTQPTLIREVTVGQTAGYLTSVNKITFTDLDINADDGYHVEIDIVNSSATSNHIVVYANNDLVPTNYKTTYLYSNSATAGSGMLQYPCLTYAAAGKQGMAIAEIRLLNGYMQYTGSENSQDTGANTGYPSATIYVGNKLATLTNITQLDFMGYQGSACFGIGSKIRLYKRKINPVLALSSKHLNNLVEEKVLAADASSVTFTGLDSLVDGDYYLELVILPGAAVTAQDIGLYINGYTTNSDYDVHQLVNWGANIAGGAASLPRVGAILSGAKCISSIRITVTGGQAMFHAHFQRIGTQGSPASDSYEITSAASRLKTNISSINSIAVITTSSMGTGSTFKLYKSNGAQQLVPYAPTDITSRTSDYYLKPGETVHLTYTNATSVPLNIATAEGEYELVVRGDASITPQTTGDLTLSPNNSTLPADSIKRSVLASFQNLTVNNATTAFSPWHDGTGVNFFVLAQANAVFVEARLSTKTKAKALFTKYVGFAETSRYCSGQETAICTDTTTAWVSLGTLTFPYAQSGTIRIKRIL